MFLFFNSLKFAANRMLVVFLTFFRENNKRHAKEMETKKALQDAELEAKIQEEKAKLDFEKKQYTDKKSYEDKGIFAKVLGGIFGN